MSAEEVEAYAVGEVTTPQFKRVVGLWLVSPCGPSQANAGFHNRRRSPGESGTVGEFVADF